MRVEELEDANTQLKEENSDLKDKIYWMRTEHREELIMAECRWHDEHWKKVYERYGIPEGGYSKKGPSLRRVLWVMLMR